MATLSRNDPCHCGSGRKYKHCHLEEDDLEARRASGGPGAPPPPSEPFNPRILVIPGLVAIALLVGVTIWRNLGDGLIVAGGWIVAATCWHIFRDPPPPKENPGDPAALNFGRSNDDRS